MRILLVGGYGLNRSLKDLADGFAEIGVATGYLPYMGDLENPAMLRQALETGSFDAVLGFCMYYESQETLDVIDQAKAHTLMWHFDSPRRELEAPRLFVRQVRPWDALLTSSLGPIVEAAAVQANVPWFGYFPPPTRRSLDFSNREVWDDAAEHLVTFLGECYGGPAWPRTVVDRFAMAERLTSEFGDELGLFGKFYVPERRVLDWPECLYYWAAPSCTIGHHGESEGYHYLNGRDIRAMGAGACYICDRSNALDTFFEEGVHCLFYDNLDDLVEKVRWCEANPEPVGTMRGRARAMILERFGHDVMAQRIVDIVRDATGLDEASEAATLEEEPIVLHVVAIESENDMPDGLGQLFTMCFGELEPDQALQVSFRPVAYRMAQEVLPPRGAAGLRVLAYSGDVLVGHVALVNRDVRGMDAGGICAVCVHPEWQYTSIGCELLDRAKEAGRLAEYQFLLGWITPETANFYRQAGMIVRPNLRQAAYMYDTGLTMERIWSAADQTSQRW